MFKVRKKSEGLERKVNFTGREEEKFTLNLLCRNAYEVHFKSFLFVISQCYKQKE
jgi:hypothetical protein